MLDRSSAIAPAASLWRRVPTVLVLVAAFAFAVFLTRFPGDGSGDVPAEASANEAVDMPAIYRPIKPAGTGSEPPPIPSAEVWPAQ